MSAASPPRLYGDLSWLWAYVSPPDHYLEEVEALRRLLQRYGVPDGGTLLHLGCGGGSIDANLQPHYRITGVDRSKGMLANARRVNPEGQYVQGDMRDVSLGRTFDAVLSHDAIAYLTTRDDVAAAYRSAARHLKPGGVLIAYPEQVREQFVQGAAQVDNAIGDEARYVATFEQNFDPDPADNTFEKTFVYLVREAGVLTTYIDTHTMGIFDLQDYVDAVKAAAFDVTVERCELSDFEHEYTVIIGIRR